MKIFIFAFGLIAGLATEKDIAVTGNNRCYQCYSSTDPQSSRSQDCFDESKLQKEEYQCTTGKVFTSGPNKINIPNDYSRLIGV